MLASFILLFHFVTATYFNENIVGLFINVCLNVLYMGLINQYLMQNLKTFIVVTLLEY